MQSDYLIIGHGDIAQRTARLLSDRGNSVTLVGRQVSAGENLAPLQTVFAADLDKLDTLANLPLTAARILYLAPPPQSGPCDNRMRNFCAELSRQLPARPQRLVYISTSGVYGDCSGALVDETRPVNPQTDRARRRVDAETILRNWGEVNKVPMVILRVAGIYGPGRLPLQRLRAGMSIVQPEQAPVSNRIHADDLARTCLAALDRVELVGVVNVCDGEPSSMSDYFIAVAREFALPEPPRISMQQAQQQFSAEMLSYLKESRRLDNSRLLQELNVQLLYPTLAAGLQAIKQQP